MLVLLGSGVILWLFRFFPLGIRTGSTLAHQLFYYFATALVAGHIVLVVVSSDRLKRARRR
jgi:branched-subunit amino acid transport protein